MVGNKREISLKKKKTFWVTGNGVKKRSEKSGLTTTESTINRWEINESA